MGYNRKGGIAYDLDSIDFRLAMYSDVVRSVVVS